MILRLSLRDRLQLLVAAALLAYIGMHIPVAIYYLLFETTSGMKSLWHSMISDSGLRHNVRDVSEGLLGGLLAQAVIWNRYRKSWLRRIEDKGVPRVTVPNALGRILLVLIYGIPGFLVGLVLVLLIHRNVTTALTSLHPVANSHPQVLSVWTKVRNGFSQSWDKKLMGYLAAFFFGRRPAKPVFDSAQLWFVERRILAGKSPSWYDMPTFKARYAEVLPRADKIDPERHRQASTIAIYLVLAVGLGLAVYGWYILTFVAA